MECDFDGTTNNLFHYYSYNSVNCRNYSPFREGNVCNLQMECNISPGLMRLKVACHRFTFVSLYLNISPRSFDGDEFKQPGVFVHMIKKFFSKNFVELMAKSNKLDLKLKCT